MQTNFESEKADGVDHGVETNGRRSECPSL